MCPTLNNTTEDEQANFFEERAEHLSQEELEAWTTFTARDRQLVRKLTGPGTKLLIGPRGSGKSTLLRKAYFDLVESAEALPVYVNYARSLALEPLIHRRADALPLFRQWVLAKIVLGVDLSLRALDRVGTSRVVDLIARSRELVRALEAGSPPDAVHDPLTPSDLLSLLEDEAESLGLRRVVLLLDDAAHAFSSEQQREFFEIFRDLRSRRVAGKAAVYPGITSYSPNFHVGHEAEKLEAWYSPYDDDFLPTMRRLVARRLPSPLRKQLEGKDELVTFVALASFGLPRGFLNMISQLVGVDSDEPVKPTRQLAQSAVQEHAEAVRGVFRALAKKLPRLKKFIDVGEELESSMVQKVRKYNALQDRSSRKTPVVAIELPIEPKLERMLNMLEYAGVVRRLDTVSRGIKGRFQRFALHHAVIFSENALSLGKSYTLSQASDALESLSAHAFARASGTALLGHHFGERCTLDLPPCTKCKTPRINEDQHFCMKCGTELANASVYEDLLSAPVDVLPLSAKKLAGIQANTNLRTVQDILLDDDSQQLRRVPYIGPVWASRIRTYAEEFVSV